MAEWKHVADLAEVKRVGVLRIFFDARAVGLFYAEGNCYALVNACPHQGGPLVEGEVIRSRVLCPWHGWTYRLTDGVCPGHEEDNVETYSVKIEEGKVFLSGPPVKVPESEA